MQHEEQSFHLPEATKIEVLRLRLATNIKMHQVLYPLSLFSAIVFIAISLGFVLQAYTFNWWASALPGVLTFVLTLQSLLLRQRITHQQNMLFLLQLDEHLAQAERDAMFSHALS